MPTGVTHNHENSLPTGAAKDVGPVLEFHPAHGDRYVSFRVEDLTGRSVILEISQEGPGGRSLEGYACHTVTPVPLKLVSDEVVSVRVHHGLCRNHNWGWATRGTVTATFSGRR